LQKETPNQSTPSPTLPTRGRETARAIARTLGPLLILVLLLTTSLQDTLYDQIQGKTNQLNGVNGQIGAARGQLNALLAQDTTLRRQIANLNAQLAQVAQQIAQETARLDDLKAQLDVIRADLAAKEAQLAKHIEDYGRSMRLMYKTGKVSPLEMILSAGNFTDLLNRIFFFNDIVRDNRRQVDELRKEREVIQALKADMDAKVAEQAQVVATIKAQQAQLESVRAQVAAQQAQVAALEAQMQRYLQEEQARRAALQAELQTLILESLRAHSSGHFNWPINGVITQGFGCTDLVFEPYAPNCPGGHFHTGIDLAANYGTPVLASDGGIVHNLDMACSWGLCGYGHYVVMVHAGGFTTLYGHLANWAQGEGAVVTQGTVIGYEGSTGNSTGPHVHFEIDLNGTPVNPMAYLP
jgi:murein DD-endopeptidase MepM/ murein hydrolase activator NlpD